MARITVEDCLEKIDNQYDLVLLAKERTVQLNSGSPMLVEEDNDKRTIISLREIADGKVDVKELEKNPEEARKAMATAFLQSEEGESVVASKGNKAKDEDITDKSEEEVKAIRSDQYNVEGEKTKLTRDTGPCARTRPRRRGRPPRG